MSVILQRDPGRPATVAELLATLAPLRVLQPRPEEVGAYLEPYPELARILPAIASRIRTAFGEEAELSLEAYVDPEIDDHYLTLYVRQPAYQDDLMARLRDISAAFEQELSNAGGWLLVTTDFRAPRSAHAI